MDVTYWVARIDATKVLIEAYENAALDLVAGNIESYTLDTGQSRQTVTRVNIASLQRVIDSLYNRLVTLEQRAYGGATAMGRPAW